MNRSLCSLSPLLSSTGLYLRASPHGVWLRRPICAAARLSTSSVGSLHQFSKLGVLSRPPEVSSEHSVWKFASNKVLNATHRSGIHRNTGGYGYGGGGGGSRGPWQRFRDSVNALPGNLLFWGIIGLNGAVFVSWNYAWAKFQSTGDSSTYLWMRHHFTSSIDNFEAGRWYTVITSAFSHESTMHLAFNGFTFYFMAPLVISMLGNFSFLGLYLGGGIVANVVGLAWRKYTLPPAQARASGAHGASGAIYSILSFFACVQPTAQFLFFGIVPLPAWLLVTGVFLYDGYCTVKQHQGTTDTVGHVGGILSGIAYFIAKRLRIL